MYDLEISCHCSSIWQTHSYLQGDLKMPLSISFPPAINYGRCYTLAITICCTRTMTCFLVWAFPILANSKKKLVNLILFFNRKLWLWTESTSWNITTFCVMMNELAFINSLKCILHTYINFYHVLYAPRTKSKSFLMGGSDDMSFIIHLEIGSSFGCCCIIELQLSSNIFLA